jgi:hypothetical protein
MLAHEPANAMIDICGRATEATAMVKLTAVGRAMRAKDAERLCLVHALLLLNHIGLTPCANAAEHRHHVQVMQGLMPHVFFKPFEACLGADTDILPWSITAATAAAAATSGAVVSGGCPAPTVCDGSAAHSGGATSVAASPPLPAAASAESGTVSQPPALKRLVAVMAKDARPVVAAAVDSKLRTAVSTAARLQAPGLSAVSAGSGAKRMTMTEASDLPHVLAAKAARRAPVLLRECPPVCSKSLVEKLRDHEARCGHRI